MTIVDRESRDAVAVEVRRFLDGETSAFDFDEALFAIDSEDPTVDCIVQRLWFHYDDIKDHTVALTRPEWNYFQRLLLILESDCHIELRAIRHRWNWHQLLALLVLLSFAVIAFQIGINFQLLLFVIPLGLVSMAIAYLRHRNNSVDSQRLSLDPFSTFAELWNTYRSVDGFQKHRYPHELAGAQIRSEATNRLMWLPTLIMWFAISPVVLIFQLFPERDGETAVIRTP